MAGIKIDVSYEPSTNSAKTVNFRGVLYQMAACGSEGVIFDRIHLTASRNSNVESDTPLEGTRRALCYYNLLQ